VRKAAEQLSDRFLVFALVYDAAHAPHAPRRLRARGTVYVPTLGGGSVRDRGGGRHSLTFLARGGAPRTVHVDIELRVVRLSV
jgi:hypothetical protein